MSETKIGDVCLEFLGGALKKNENSFFTSAHFAFER